MKVRKTAQNGRLTVGPAFGDSNAVSRVFIIHLRCEPDAHNAKTIASTKVYAELELYEIVVII